jgi:biopolymer transport protein ExbD
MESVDRQSRGWSPSSRNAQRARRRESSYHSRLDDTLFALGAIFLVLLFIMMIVRQGGDLPRSVVDLARVSSSAPKPDAQRDDAMRVTISASGDVYFGTSHVASAELPAKFREGMQAGAEKRIYMAVDARAHYGDVKLVLDEIHRAGITNVTFITQ